MFFKMLQNRDPEAILQEVHVFFFLGDSGPLTQKCWAQETFYFGVMGVTTCSGLLQMVPAYTCCLSLIVHRPPFHF